MRSVWRSSAIFVATYLFSVGVAMWINNPVLCVYGPSSDFGCEGFVLYFPLWALLYSPLVVLALIIAHPKKLRGEPYARGFLLSSYLVVTVIALELSFIFDVGPIILAEWILIGGLFIFLRRLVLSESRRPV
jgi:hypothetical protein